MSKLIATVYKERTLGLGVLPTVALEEQVQAIEEACALQQQLEGTFAETERAAPMVSALEDLAFVVDHIREITPKEAALIQVAGDFAAAGTEDTGEVITPAMEDMLGDARITGAEVVRKVKETIARIIAAIKQLLRQASTYIASYIQRLMLIAGGSETRLKKLEKAYDELSSAGTLTKNVDNIKIQLPTVQGKGVSSMQELLAESAKFADVMGNFMDSVGDANYEYGSGFVRLYESDLAIKKTEGQTVQHAQRDGTVRLLQQISGAFNVPRLFSGYPAAHLSGPDGSIITQTPQLIGGIRIEAEYIPKDVFASISMHSSTSVQDLIARVAHRNRITVVNDAVSAAAVVEVEAMSMAEIAKAIKLVKQLLTFYSARSGSRSISASLQKRTAFSRTCCDQIASRVSKMDTQNPLCYAMSLQSLIVTNSITKSATVPYTRLSEASGRTISYLLTAISKSIAAHAKGSHSVASGLQLK